MIENIKEKEKEKNHKETFVPFVQNLKQNEKIIIIFYTI